MSNEDERTPLLTGSERVAPKYTKSHFRWLMFTVFTSAFSFSLTATPQIFSFRTFACEEFYKTHPPYTGSGDRCSRLEVDSKSAANLSVMVTLIMVSAVINLLFVGSLIKRFGNKITLIQQTIWPMVRLVVQLFGISYGGAIGTRCMQLSQLCCIIGGPGGYYLCANSFVSEIVEPEQHTSSFGISQGISMAGMATAFSIGGLLGDKLGLAVPFQCAIGLFAFTTIVTALVLPSIPLKEPKAEDQKKKKSMFSFLDPLKVFAPRKLSSPDGKQITYFGLTFLGIGCFMAVLASFYVAMMLQLVATQLYEFHPTENGYLMSTFSLSRAFFLTILFPRIISLGRKWFAKTTTPASPAATSSPVEDIPTTVESFEPIIPVEASGEEPIKTPKPTDVAHGSKFDLWFLRWSIVVDAILTSGVAFSSCGWHMYLAAGILPFASGTAPAAKGVIMEMVPAEDRSDALSGIALVETLAGIVTVSAFGELFAYLASIGHTNLVFFFNAGTALFAAFLLLFARFPPSSFVSSA